MNAKLSRQMALLGLGVLVFYAGLLATGQVSIEILPQFAISAVVFLCSGKIMRQIASKLPARENEDADEQPEPDWEMRTLVLNWLAAFAVIAIVALFIVKPAGMTFAELGQFILQTDFAPEMSVPFAP
jgi:hypothetical protein